jgi:hypothetical protein
MSIVRAVENFGKNRDKKIFHAHTRGVFKAL